MKIVMPDKGQKLLHMAKLMLIANTIKLMVSKLHITIYRKLAERKLFG